MTANQNWVLRIAVGAKDQASGTLRKISGAFSGFSATWRKFNGVMRMTGVSRALAGVRDLTIGLGRTFIDAGRKAALFGGLAGTAMGALVQRTTKAGEETLRVAERINLGAEKLQEWRLAAREAGIPAEQLDATLDKLGGRISKIFRRDDAAGFDVFQYLNVKLADAEGRMLGVADVLPQIADGLMKVGDAGKRLDIAKILFEDQGPQFVSMLKGGAAGLGAAASAARAAGAISTDEELGRMAEFQSAVRGIGTEVNGVWRQIVTAMLPALQDTADITKEWLVDNQPRVREFAELIRTELPDALRAFRDDARTTWGWWDERVGASWRFLKFFAEGVKDLGASPATGGRGWFERQWDQMGKESPLETFKRFDGWMATPYQGFNNAFDAKFGAPRETRSPVRTLDALMRDSEKQSNASGSLRVEFANMPRGARVTRDEGSRRFTTLDVGYAMREGGLA